MIKYYTREKDETGEIDVLTEHEFVTAVPEVFKLNKWTTIKVTGRGGDGERAVVEPTFSNFRVMQGFGGLKFANGTVTLGGSNAAVTFNSYNVFSENKNIKVLIAAYKDSLLLGVRAADTEISVGEGACNINVDFAGVSITDATSFKAFFTDTENILKPYGCSSELEIQ